MPVLTLKNITLGYEKNIILKNFSLELNSGELFFIKGANGSGKSTLLRGIIGLARIFSGEIIKKENIKIAYVPQAESEKTEFNFPASIHEIVLTGRQRPWHFFYDAHDKKAADYAMTRFKINDINKNISFISGGQMRRVLLARALCSEPDLLLLDEPCAGLDADGREIFYDYVKDLRDKNNTAVLMVTHDNNNEDILNENRVIKLK